MKKVLILIALLFIFTIAGGAIFFKNNVGEKGGVVGWETSSPGSSSFSDRGVNYSPTNPNHNPLRIDNGYIFLQP